MTSFDTTPFVVDGKNTASITIEANPSSTSVIYGTHTITFPAKELTYQIEMKDQDASLFAHDFILHSCQPVRPDALRLVCSLAIPVPNPADNRPLSARRSEKHFEFAAQVPVRWRWQDADDVGDLGPQDRAAIQAIINELAEAYRRRNWKAVKTTCVTWWIGSRPPANMAREDRRFDIIARFLDTCKDYTVFMVPAESLRFDSGSKIVRVYAEDGPIISAGPVVRPVRGIIGDAMAETQPRLGDGGAIHFLKLGGRWRPILATPSNLTTMQPDERSTGGTG